MIIEGNLLAKVREILKRDDTILFIGSGLSLWSGLPSWTGLLEEMASFIENLGYSPDLIRREVSNGNLLQAASYGVDLLTPPQFSRFILSACRYGRALPNEIHRKVVKLGPTCFITTNYDHLIEDAFREAHKYELYPVTNKQLTETANIVQTRATKFIFKPHGDVNDCDSIILTREQYRSILHGERRSSLDALKTLLISRPIVFLGFGLRDPDFMFVQDSLLEVFKGGVCDYYSVMVNVSDQERSFWLRNYGVHILSYQAKEENKRNHSGLLDLLNKLLPVRSNSINSFSTHENKHPFEYSSDHVLALIRYAKKVVFTMPHTSKIELPLRASREKKHQKSILEKDSNIKIDELLNQRKENIVLIGNPGAGKTYALKRYCSFLASELEDVCLNDVKLLPTVSIPLYIDLKLYSGNLWQSAEEVLPSFLPLSELCDRKQIIFVLDSYNEIPREYIENGHIDEDLAAFVKKIGDCRYIIASRTSDSLQKLGLPIFLLDEIDHMFVIRFLKEQGVNIGETFRYELLSLLRKPLYFRLYSEKKIVLQNGMHPRQIYESLFATLANNFLEKFRTTIDLRIILSPIAFDLVSRGQETFGLNEFEEKLQTLLTNNNVVVCDSTEFINWLVGCEILIPAPGSRLSFFHQSITEYLAASELAHQYVVTPKILDECLKYMRWDQALYLTLGFLDVSHLHTFMHHIIQTNFELAIKAAKYIEGDCDGVINEILDSLLLNSKSKERDHGIKTLHYYWILRDLPVSIHQERRLRKLLIHRGRYGGLAAELLTRIHGNNIKGELVEEMFKHASDSDFCYGVVWGLRPLMEIEDLIQFINRLGKLVFTAKELYGLTTSSSTMFGLLDPNQSLDVFLPWQQLNSQQLHFFTQILMSIRTPKSFQIMIELIADNHLDALFPFHLFLNDQLREKKFKLDFDLINNKIVNILIKDLASDSDGKWSFETLNQLCELESRIKDIVKKAILDIKGITKLILLYCCSKEEIDFWNEMRNLIKLKLTRNDKKLLKILEDFELDWGGKEDILLSLLQSADSNVVNSIANTNYDILFRKVNPHLKLSFMPLETWLNVLINTQSLRFALGRFIGDFAPSMEIQQLLAMFNQKDCPYKEILAYDIFWRISEITLDMLSTDAIDFLIADLYSNKYESFNHRGKLLANISTDEFVREHLLPLMNCKEEPFHSNLLFVVEEIGKRLGIRYILN